MVVVSVFVVSVVQAGWRHSHAAVVLSCGNPRRVVYRAPSNRPTSSFNSVITCVTRTIVTVRSHYTTCSTCCGAGASSYRGDRWRHGHVTWRHAGACPVRTITCHVAVVNSPVLLRRLWNLCKFMQYLNTLVIKTSQLSFSGSRNGTFILC